MSKVYTLETLFKEFSGGIRVPRIQRGYVQGREDAKGKEIRANFVPELVNAVFDKKNVTLDFIYGVALDDEDGLTLLPLDGQQRLSTLFLLAWLCGKWKDGWRFDYEARRIPQLFVKGLREHPATASVAPSEEIRDSSWFLPVWENEPTVAGMLRMLEAMHNALGTRNREDADFGRISFLLHGIDGKGETFDHIFRKMNARGKELSPWENLKALLDREVPESLADKWRDRIDGEWAETIWEHTGNNISKLDTAMEKIVRIAFSRVAGPDRYNDSLFQIEQQFSSDFGKDGEENTGERRLSQDFFAVASLYFNGIVNAIPAQWGKDRKKNALWTESASASDEEFWKWLFDSKYTSMSDRLRIAFLAETNVANDGQRRRRVLLNLLDNTGDMNSDKYKSLLNQGLKFLADGNMNGLTDFHNEQITDEQWKAAFDENEILEIERHPLVWLGSTAFLGEIDPCAMNNALALLKREIEQNGKKLFMDVLGLSGKCDNGLPCGNMKIPECNREWAEECFSVRRLFLRGGIQSRLKEKHYEVNSGTSPWLYYLSCIWEAVKERGLKRISTKDYGWLFCVKNENLTGKAIRLIKSKNEIDNMARLDGVQVASKMPYLDWSVLPYDGYMKAQNGDLYFNVKSESWKSEKPMCYMRAEDGRYIRHEEPKSTSSVLSKRELPSSL